jgi:serine/threonine-protein kinase PBS1
MYIVIRIWHLQAQPMFKDQKRYHELVDPLIKKEYPAKALNQVVAMAAMCLQEEDSVRPLMADVVMTLGFLMSMPPDPPSPAVVAPPTTDPEPKQVKRLDHSNSSSSSSSSEDEVNEEEEEDEEDDRTDER